MIALASLAAAAALAAAPAAPPSAPTTPLLLGARVSALFPAGDLEPGAKLSDSVQRAFPLELVAGWKLKEQVVVGLAGGYVPSDEGAAWKATCTDLGVTCSVHGWRLAARGEYRWPFEEWTPWTAATLGWEWLTRRWEQGTSDWEERRHSGWTLGAEAGVDDALTPRFAIGIFAGFSLGQFRSVALSGETAGYAYSGSPAVRDPAVHYGFQVGVRFGFGI
jgi:hypothetical protein